MDIRAALKSQYHAGLKMLRETVEICPDEVWTSGQHPRTYWRIAFHGVVYTHLYLQPNEAAFKKWGKDRENCAALWGGPEVLSPYTKEEMLEYIDHVAQMVDATVDILDLSSPETGFYWYTNMTKLEHQLMNLRHLQGHIGQLSEILMTHGVDTNWVGRASVPG